MSKPKIKGMSLFSSSGIGEYYLNRAGIEIIVANELIPKRGKLYENIYPNQTMIIGDIKDSNIFNKIRDIAINNKIDFLIASPPCQGISIAGKNRKFEEMSLDQRNYLITYVIEMIKQTNPKYIIIENVPLLLKLKLFINDELLSLTDILKEAFSNDYNIDYDILDASDYGTPQVRKRAIIRMYKKNLIWNWPKKESRKITVEEAIGNLPSIEAGEDSSIKWHFGRKHDARQILWMQHTPTGHSAFENEIYYPKRKDGTRIKGYESSYRRIRWDHPAPTITIRNDAISSQRNVHPGHKLSNGTYSDARVLSILELMRLTGLPDNWPINDNTPELLIRQVLGECIPPLLVESLVKEIKHEY
ncbi:DNA (cytosine-5-)-methyltransferase [Mammaliicoccus sciuri]|uniref:DNA (cytosine-5-)-methyltransferase n=1 Tax=Mammaliicoccus sciuri TaxID=1296 RepID=UPI0008076EC1|nr:DNA (cytosine-5-)-methyltransferase [Mammaliicoccus sciuri]MBU6089364.1 DNA cytosine methyltransferase [Mammaliicoccus sciuri]MBW3109351.1 DNA cytosine methyltransferase [Mammaliicoccus sciuri]MCH5140923.1 DNA (cytosine-5-)-methyltransferase [Mammaliicoccus sciuri]MEB6263888.1 DNA cytosine methyltransferase [Mammaliicoccus sciuri]MEB7845116.1 DNA cytosine methyltransferase [Mammaliicoccus sciuri]